MKKIGKINLNEISNADLSVFEMNRIFGGEGGSGTYDDPFQLPEVYVYGKYNPCATNVNGCCQCPQYGWGPNAAGDPWIEFGYRAGVMINHLLYH
ncbi:MAG: TIGR04149 family rSAM-modified RiPP [Candidatus Symbiothrix sp.]|jgi:natural product precursor|nr:TIGR04149 family rSAM-modified RiPP [Candidatus Symbiothrix sp.]